MISEKFIVTVGLVCFFIACVGAALLFSGMNWGRYIVYPSVFIGAITIMIGAIAISTGKSKKNINDKS